VALVQVSDYVASYNGYPLGSIKKAFARTVEAAKLGKDVAPYTLRHTVASWLAQAGVPLVEIASSLHHADISPPSN
jgi:site-specific recombinase XerD